MRKMAASSLAELVKMAGNWGFPDQRAVLDKDIIGGTLFLDEIGDLPLQILAPDG